MQPRTMLASMMIVAAITVAASGAAVAGPWSAAVAAGMGSASAPTDMHKIGRWSHHPRRHMRYRIPPDIFKPRCWVNRWGDLHCPYARRVRHSERRRCTVDPWGRLVCPN